MFSENGPFFVALVSFYALTGSTGSAFSSFEPSGGVTAFKVILDLSTSSAGTWVWAIDLVLS
jgi:hypothetical protein